MSADLAVGHSAARRKKGGNKATEVRACVRCGCTDDNACRVMWPETIAPCLSAFGRIDICSACLTEEELDLVSLARDAHETAQKVSWQARKCAAISTRPEVVCHCLPETGVGWVRASIDRASTSYCPSRPRLRRIASCCRASFRRPSLI